jgi:glutamate N-acetyltransferase/amino-acid N-acetyltransferase
VIASTGKIGEWIALETFENALRPLVQGLEATEEASLRAAEAIMTTDSYPKHTAFSFELGDFTCKMGVLFKGNVRIAPNMATTLIFLTTDVNISPEMLQKALHLTVKDTVNLLCADGISSPNDTVCILANGKAGNYKISNDDTEFAKFTAALKRVLTEVCRRIAQDCDEQDKILLCKVMGAKSQPAAHAIARKVVSSLRIRQAIVDGRLDVESIAYAIAEGDPAVCFKDAQIALCNEETECVICEENGILPVSGENLSRLARGKELMVRISLQDGNYTATAFGCLQVKTFV